MESGRTRNSRETFLDLQDRGHLETKPFISPLNSADEERIVFHRKTPETFIRACPAV